MEILAGILALLAGLGGGAGWFVDHTVRNRLHDELDSADVLEVRVETIPNVALVTGRIDRLAIAGRGLTRAPLPRIEVLELETDPIKLSLDDGAVALDQPLQGAVRVAISETDINAALNSPALLENFQDLQADLPFVSDDQALTLSRMAIDTLEGDRLRVSVLFVEQSEIDPEATSDNSPGSPPSLDIVIDTQIDVEDARRIRLRDLSMTLNNEPVPPELTELFVEKLEGQLDLTQFTNRGIDIHLLSLSLTEDTIEAVAFTQIDSLQALENNED